MVRRFLHRQATTRKFPDGSPCTFVVNLLGAFFVVSTVAVSWAQRPELEVQPQVDFVSLPDAPLKWVGQRSTVDDELSEITLRNVGKDTVKGFQIGWVLFIPDGCGVREAGVPLREEQVEPYREEMIKPGQTVTIDPYHLSSESIRNFARHAHSPVVIVQAGVCLTRFAPTKEKPYPLEQSMLFGQRSETYPCEGHQKPAEAEDALKTYYAAEFTFQYASLLIPCEKKEQGTGDGYFWAQNSCSAYFPVCDDMGGQGSNTIVCIAYPREKFADAPTFEAAAFSVTVVEQVRNEKDCRAGSPDWQPVSSGSGKVVTITDMKFNVFETGEAGMSQGVDAQVYRTFHGGKCYQLSIRMANANGGAFDGDINEFSKEDDAEVRGRLGQALNSFRFSK